MNFKNAILQVYFVNFNKFFDIYKFNVENDLFCHKKSKPNRLALSFYVCAAAWANFIRLFKHRSAILTKLGALVLMLRLFKDFV